MHVFIFLYTNIICTIIYSIIEKPLTSCMISYWPVSCATMILSKKYDIIYYIYDFMYDIVSF